MESYKVSDCRTTCACARHQQTLFRNVTGRGRATVRPRGFVTTIGVRGGRIVERDCGGREHGRIETDVILLVASGWRPELRLA